MILEPEQIICSEAEQSRCLESMRNQRMLDYSAWLFGELDKKIRCMRPINPTKDVE
jgi:hypothetical protein